MLANLEGTRLDTFRLIKRLGGGTYGDVYLAEDERRNQQDAQVAIKAMEPLKTQESMQVFLREVRALVRLHHPHIVPLRDFNIDEKSSLPFIVMEYAPNGSLRQRHPKGTVVPLTNVVSYVRQLADALQHAHNDQLIHRDVKPHNVLIGSHDELLLSDFGIATSSPTFNMNRSRPVQENIAGSASYMAPEQCRGHAVKASDQYALAIMVYEWLCGTCPFKGDTVEVIFNQHMNIAPRPLRTLVPGVPPQVEAVIMKALAKSPKDRFPTISDFAAALETANSTAFVVNVANDDQKISPLPLSYSPPIVHNPESPVQDKITASLSISHAHNKEPENHAFVRQSLPFSAPPQTSEPDIIHFPVISERPTRNLPSANDKVVAVASETIRPVPLPQPAMRDRILPPRWRRGKALLVACIALLLLLSLVGYALTHLIGADASDNTITIVPTSQTVSGNFAILAVTGTPNSSQRQVQARQLSYTTPVQSKTVNATGVHNIPATQAQGSLTFYNTNPFQQTVAAGTVFTVRGVQIENDVAAIVPAGNLPSVGIVTVPAHAITTGSVGNIPAGVLSGSCCTGGVAVKNQTFSGGQDSQGYTIIQQSDIDNVANPLVNPTEQNALNTLKGQRHANEQFVGQPRCAPNVNANPPVGSKSQTVTVSVSASCSGEVYDHSGAIAMVVTSLQSQASKVPGTNYKLFGNIVPTITQLTVVDGKRTISIVIKAEGIWEYNFTKTLEAQLAWKIAGKTRQVAQAILAGYQSIGKVVSISLSSNTLPTDPSQIHIVIQDMPGLSGTPVSSGSPTTITPTSGSGTPQPGTG